MGSALDLRKQQFLVKLFSKKHVEALLTQEQQQHEINLTQNNQLYKNRNDVFVRTSTGRFGNSYGRKN